MPARSHPWVLSERAALHAPLHRNTRGASVGAVEYALEPSCPRANCNPKACEREHYRYAARLIRGRVHEWFSWPHTPEVRGAAHSSGRVGWRRFFERAATVHRQPDHLFAQLLEDQPWGFLVLVRA